MTVACTNPARPGAKGWVPLDSYWTADRRCPSPAARSAWSSEGEPPTPLLRTEGLVSGRCVNDGPRGYLSIRTNADPRRQAHRPHRRRSRRARHVHSRLGHASRRHEPGPRATCSQVSAWSGEIGSGQPPLGGLLTRRVARDSRMAKAGVMSDHLDQPYRGGFVGQRAPLRADRLFRGHRHSGHRLLRQLSEIYGAGPVRHAARRRHRPARRTWKRTKASMRWRTSRSAIFDPAKLGDDLVVHSTVEQVRAASVVIHQRVMRGSEQLTDARVTAAFLDPGRPAEAPAEGVGREVRSDQNERGLNA